MPAPKEVRFIPDLIIDTGDIFFQRVAAGSSLNHLVPAVPVGRFFGIGGIGKGKEGAGAGCQDTIYSIVQAGEVKGART